MRGGITPRGPRIWRLRWDDGQDPTTGRRRQATKTVHGALRDAQAELRRILHSLETGTYVKPTRLTLGQHLEEWLKTYVRPNLAPRTTEGYDDIARRHLIPALGAITLVELKPSHLQAYYGMKMEMGRADGKGPLSARTVLHHHRTLHQALEFAVKWGRVARNVAKAVDPPRPGQSEMQLLDRQGVLRLLEVTRATLYYPLFYLAVSTGMRRSELLGLLWKHLDLERGTVSISQVLHQLRGGRLVLREPKSPAARRAVDLPQGAVLVLRQQRERMEAEHADLGKPLSGEDFVFARADGSPLLPNTVTHAFQKAARRAGLTGFRFHDLRHSHASLLLMMGTHPKVVQERLGHSTSRVTLDLYSHVAPGIQRRAAEQFDRVLREVPAGETDDGS